MKVTWHVSKYGNPYSELVLCIYPIQSAHTQQWTHPGAVGSHLCCGTRGAVGGLVPCSRAPQSCIEGGESSGYSLPPPTIPARPETRTRNILGYESDSLTIRPWLPQILLWVGWDCNFINHREACLGALKGLWQQLQGCNGHSSHHQGAGILATTVEKSGLPGITYI